MQSYQEKVFKGIPLAGGIAEGVLFFIEPEQEAFFPKFPIKLSDVASEVNRYRKAISLSKEELVELEKALKLQGSLDASHVIASHINMLEDPLVTTMMEEKIGQMLQNTETVFRAVMGDYEKNLSNVDNEFFRERLIDVRDLSNRILKHLLPDGKRREIQLPKSAILLIQELEPSTAAEACLSGAIAFISEQGGQASHTAVIAKNRNLAYISMPDFSYLKQYHLAEAIMDGDLGTLIIYPTQETKESYREMTKKRQEKRRFILEEMELESVTIDGIKVLVQANIDGFSDLPSLEEFQLEEIGLFRTEFLLLNSPSLAFSFEEQKELYKEMKKRVKNKTVTYRLFDLGEDKNFLIDTISNSQNLRSIRYLFAHIEILKTQLKALLMAYQGGYVKILIPFVSEASEVLQVKALIEALINEYSIEVTFSLGAMIETPAAVVSSEMIAEVADFISIGTNDLIQYVTAIRRDSYDYHPFHPGLYKMIEYVVSKAEKFRRRVSICGEIASDPLFTTLLIGLGVRELSCAPCLSPEIKHCIRRLSIPECEAFAQEIIALGETQLVKKTLESKREFSIQAG